MAKMNWLFFSQYFFYARLDWKLLGFMEEWDAYQVAINWVKSLRASGAL
jgi:nucleoside-specific outer membrane channel protein Tsx